MIKMWLSLITSMRCNFTIKSKRLAGIYIHIPYCQKACHYCNFHFSTTLNTVPDMVAAIKKELFLRKNEIGEPVETIYFGGGTPSILETRQLSEIIDTIYKNYDLRSNLELTLEANPENITPLYSEEIKKAGVNRISLGVQSFEDEILKFLNRSHSSDQVRSSVDHLRSAGISNINMDLIYGIPGQSREMWSNNLNKMLALEPNHISAYALTIEDKTAFGNWHRKGKLSTLPEESVADQYDEMVTRFAAQGYEHYEVSNFALPDYLSRHNTAYWRDRQYLGIGPAAHSFNKRSRKFNVANNAKYIRLMSENTLAYEEEVLSKEERINEYLLTGLRTKYGISLRKLASEHGYNLPEDKINFLKQISDQEMGSFDGDTLILNSSGFIISDSIVIELMP